MNAAPRSVCFVRVVSSIVLLALAWLPMAAQAQVGRLFVTAEAHVGLARMVHVGKIVELEPVEYEGPLEGPQKLGKPYRLVFEVAETLRGEAVKRVELILAVQTKRYLETLRDSATPVLLTGGPLGYGSFMQPEIGIEEQGKPVAGQKYQFRVLDPMAVPASGEGEAEVKQINVVADEGRMFTNTLQVVTGSTAVLERMRAFAKNHPDLLEPVMLEVPREFGRLVGDPNAYAGLVLPVCPESRATLEALKKDPGIILRQIKVENEERTREGILAEVEKTLGKFPAE